MLIRGKSQVKVELVQHGTIVFAQQVASSSSFAARAGELQKKENSRSSRHPLPWTQDHKQLPKNISITHSTWPGLSAMKRPTNKEAQRRPPRSSRQPTYPSRSPTGTTTRVSSTCTDFPGRARATSASINAVKSCRTRQGHSRVAHCCWVSRETDK